MPKLKSTRNALPASQPGMPGPRKYSMPDKGPGKGKLSPAAAARIRSKANSVLGKSC